MKKTTYIGVVLLATSACDYRGLTTELSNRRGKKVAKAGPREAAGTPFSVKDGNFAVNEDAVLTDSLVGGDAKEKRLTFDLIKEPRNGSLSFSGNSTGDFIYTPKSDFSGGDKFSYSVSDGGEIIQATAMIEVVGINDAPSASKVSITLTEDQILPANGQLVGVDTDTDKLTFKLIKLPTKGTVTLIDAANGTFTYAPFSNVNGEDSFSYLVNDGHKESSEEMVSIAIAAVNDAPFAFGQAPISIEEEEKYEGKLEAADPEGDALTFILVDDVKNGKLTFNPDGTFQYKWDDHGDTSFSFKVSDGSAESAVVAVEINVYEEQD